MLSAPKGQEGIQDSHPVQASLSIIRLAIRFPSYLNWKIDIMEWWNVGSKAYDSRAIPDFGQPLFQYSIIPKKLDS
jgi:hypothetical protein